jgi:uncharacterized OB-fold protein
VSAIEHVHVHDGLVRETAEGPRLIGAKCMRCSNRSFPYSDTCPWCGDDGTYEVTLSPTGALWAWTAVTTAPPGYEAAVPFGFGVVELDGDDLRVVTRLTIAEPDRLQFGERVELVLDEVGRDAAGAAVVTWAFAPAGEA